MQFETKYGIICIRMDRRSDAPSQALERNTDTTISGEVNVLPNIKSAKKRVKVIETKSLQNKMFRSQLKTVVKKFEACVAEGNKAEAEVAYKDAVKKIDQAVAHNIMHKNTAAHKKSHITKKLNAMA